MRGLSYQTLRRKPESALSKKKKARKRQMTTKMTMVPFAALLLTFSLGAAPTNTKNKSEVWSIDQSDSAGKNFGGTYSELNGINTPLPKGGFQ